MKEDREKEKNTALNRIKQVQMDKVPLCMPRADDNRITICPGAAYAVSSMLQHAAHPALSLVGRKHASCNSIGLLHVQRLMLKVHHVWKWFNTLKYQDDSCQKLQNCVYIC